MSIDEAAPSQLEDRFAVLLPHLNERQRRLAVATEARLLGHGGVRVAARAAGMGETTVRRGVAELEAGQDPFPHVRRCVEEVRPWVPRSSSTAATSTTV